MTQVFFKKNPITLEKNLIAHGAHFPNIKFTMQNLEEADLSKFKGQKLILWFVPSLDTGVCITSAKKLNTHLKKHPGTQALICSMDLPFAQKRVCGLETLDQVHAVSLFRHPESLEMAGLKITEGPLKGLSARYIAVLDSHHNLVYHQLCEEITDEPNYSECFHFIDHMKS
jgi:thiol peroxidase